MTGTLASENARAELESLLPHYLALAAALSLRGRHGEAAALLLQAQQDAGPDQEQVGGVLVDELIADADYERVLTAALDLVNRAPLAACRALTHLRDGVRPSQLPNAAPLLLEMDWGAFARGTETPQPVRANILAAVARILQGHGRFQESADFLRALPPEFDSDLRFQYYLGVALVFLRQWPAAQEVLSGAVRALVPSTPPDLAEGIRFTLAELHECLGNVSEALLLLDPDATTGAESRARCLALRALCHAEMGRPEQAQEDRAAADSLAPHAEAVVVMGSWVLLATGDFGAAAKRTADGLRRYPESDELSFLRYQTSIADGTDVAKQSRRVRRLVERLDQADLSVLVSRTLRLRAEEDASLYYFLAVVQRFAGHDEDALARAGEAVLRLTAKNAAPSEFTVAARRLRAELLQASDPAGAAAEYAAAGLDAFGLEDWNAAVDLLSTARRIGPLDQLGHWYLAEAYFLTSFVAAERMGLSEGPLRQAAEIWDDTFAKFLPDVQSSWAYVSRARMELSLARLERRSPAHALQAMLYCECALALAAPTSPLMTAYAQATRLLQLYALSAEVQLQGAAADLTDASLLVQLLSGAANNGNLELSREYLPELERVSVDTSWHAEVARVCLLDEDPLAALSEIARTAPADRTWLYFDWLEFLAHARLGDTDGVASVLGRVRDRMEEADSAAPSGSAATVDSGAQVCFRILLGELDAAARLLDRMADEDSWWTSVTLDAALIGLLGGQGAAEDLTLTDAGSAPEGAHEEAVHEFLEWTRSFEDVGSLATVLGEVRARRRARSTDPRGTGIDAALGRLLVHAGERLRLGGWPRTVEADLASLRDRPWPPEQERRARAAEASIASRRAMDRQDWQGAIEGYGSLLAADADFPEAEQGLIVVVSRAIDRFTEDGSGVLADAVSMLTEVLPQLRGIRRRPRAEDLLEIWLGDAHVHLEDLDGARRLYEDAFAAVGERAARHVVTARLHVAAALLERPADGPGFDAVLKSCAASGTRAADALLDAASALVRSAAGWQRLIRVWEEPSARLAATARPEDADLVALLLVEAETRAGWASRQLGDLDQAQADLRRAFELHRDLAGPDDPGVLSRRHTLAGVLAELRRFPDAEAELRGVIDGRSRELGIDNEDTLLARLDLGKVLFEEGRPAEAGAEFSLVADARSRVLGEDSIATWDVRYLVARALQDQGRLEEAEQAFREVVDADRRLRGELNADALSTRLELARIQMQLGRFGEAEAELRAVAEVRSRELGADDPSTLLARYHLAGALRGQGELEAAEREYREVLAGETRVQGAEDPSTLITRHQLGSVLRDLGRFGEAEAELRAVAEARARVLGADDPATVSARQELASVLRDLGRFGEAEAVLRAVAEVRARVLGREDLSTLVTRHQLGWLLGELGRFGEAEAELRAVTEARARVLGADDPATVSARQELAWVLRQLGRFGEAEAELRAVAEVRARVLGGEDPGTLITRHQLSSVLRQLGRFDEAEAELHAVIDARARVLGADDPATVAGRQELGWVLGELGRFDEAEAELRAVAEARARVLGADDPATLAARQELGGLLGELDRFDEAEAELRAVAEARARVLGADDPSTLLARYHLAGALRGQGELEAAEREYREVLAGETRVQGAEDPSTLITRHQLGSVLRDLGRFGEAEAELRAVAEARGRVLGEEDPSTLTTRHQLGWLLGELGRFDEAEAEMRAVTEARARLLGADDPATVSARQELGWVLRELGRFDEAEAEMRAVAEARARVLGADDPATLAARQELGGLLGELGRFGEAEAELRAVAEVRSRELGADDPSTLLARYHLAGALRGQGELEAAEREYREVLAGETRVQGAEDPSTLITRHQLGSVLRDLGRFGEAEAELRAVAEARGRVLGPDDPATLAAWEEHAAIRMSLNERTPEGEEAADPAGSSGAHSNEGGQ